MLTVISVWQASFRRAAEYRARTAVVHLCAVTLSLVVCSGQTASQRPQPGSQERPILNEVLSWLPDDTETIIGATGPFPLPDLDKDLVQGSLELRMAAFPLGPFGFRNGDLRKFLKGKTLALAVEGSRRSKAPAEVAEPVEFRGEACEIAVFSDSVAAERDSYMMDAAKSAARFEEMAGVRFAIFNEPRADEVWTTFVGFPRNNIVLIATSADYVRGVLARLGGASGARALPGTLPEWKYVNTRARAWGVRHYDRRMAAFDPQSPFRTDKTENVLAKLDNGAVGVSFWFEPTRRMATVTYLSQNRNARQILQDDLETADSKVSPPVFQMRLREPTQGVVGAVVTVSNVQILDLFLGVLGAMLGHAAFI